MVHFFWSEEKCFQNENPFVTGAILPGLLELNGGRFSDGGSSLLASSGIFLERNGRAFGRCPDTSHLQFSYSSDRHQRSAGIDQLILKYLRSTMACMRVIRHVTNPTQLNVGLVDRQLTQI